MPRMHIPTRMLPLVALFALLDTTPSLGAEEYTARLGLAGSFQPPRDVAVTSVPPAEIMGHEVSSNFSGSTSIDYFAKSDRGTIEHYASVFGGGYSTGVNANWELSASWRWDDLIFTCQDGRTQVDNVRLNVRIKGSQGFTTVFTTNPTTSWAYMWASLNGGTCGSCGAGIWYPSGNRHRFVQPSTGVFAGISSTSLDGVFTYKPSTSPGPLNLPTNVPVTIRPYSLDVRTVARNGWSTAVFNTAGGELGMTLPTDRPVFELPQGCTCNSEQANIVDNMWLGTVPPPSTVTVSGRVLSDCEGPLQGVMVDVHDANGVVSCVTTDELGRFTVMGVPGSTEPGHVVIEPPPGYEEVDPIEISLESNQELGDITLTCTYVDVSGTVTSNCGDPAGGVVVNLSNGDGDLVTTTAAPDGSYEFSHRRYDGMLWAVTAEPPAGFTAPDTILVDLTSDAVADPVLGCIYVGVSGSVTSDCHGAEGGVTVSLAVAGRDTAVAATEPDGTYTLSARYSTTAGALAVAVPAGLEAVTPPGGRAEVALTENQAANFVLRCLRVDVSGSVTSNCTGPLLGVTVDLLDAQGEFHTTVTNGSGAYVFADLPYSTEPDAAEVSIAIPLGYEAVSPGVAGVALTPDQDRVVDFSLACLNPTGAPRSMGYWKHNANVYLSGRGSAQESQANMTTNFPAAIFEHFHENGLNGIAVNGVTYMGNPAGALDLATIGATLTVNRGGTMLDRAKQQYLAFLLNVASGKLATGAVVTADGGTASQVLQYLADLINDGNASNDEIAKNLSETVNDAQQITAGVVPLDQYGDISYAMRRFANMPFQVSPNPGGPHPYVFSFGMPQAGQATLDVYDVSGRRVATPLSRSVAAGAQRVVWADDTADGQRLARGVYFARLMTPEGAKVLKFVHMGK